MIRVNLASLAIFTGLLGLSGCENAGLGLGASIDATNAVSVGVYLDRDGSRTLTTPLDTVYTNARVALLVLGATDTFRVATTNAIGIARFDRVPLGQYKIAIDPRTIGDSIQVQAIDSTNIRIKVGDTLTFSLARLGYPEVTIRQVRNSPTGRRVFMRGVVLAGVQSFRDTTSHVSDSSGQLRLTRVALRGGLVGNVPGDSVSILGVISTRAGQPVLDQAILARFGARPAPIPIAVGTGPAGTANNGALDAALVQVTGAIISDTLTVAPDFEVKASDGSGVLRILLDGNINFQRSNFRPNRSVNVRGVLVPTGAGAWSLKPRDVNDVVFN